MGLAVKPPLAVGPSAADWLIEWGTVGLAFVTVVALVVTICITVADRHRDRQDRDEDAKVAAERLRDERDIAKRRLKDERDHAEQTARRSGQDLVTGNLITEFFSDRFLKHRIIVSKLQCGVENGDADISQIACGYWYPWRPGSYHGDKHGKLDEHQHLEAFIGYIVRFMRPFAWSALMKGVHALFWACICCGMPHYLTRLAGKLPNRPKLQAREYRLGLLPSKRSMRLLFTRI